VGTHDELWSGLTAIATLRLAGPPPAGARLLLELSESARKRILEILRKAIDRDIVARWELVAFRSEAKRAAARKLRTELEPTVNALRSYEDAARGQRAEVEQVLNGLLGKG
jgi:hypothetical protein